MAIRPPRRTTLSLPIIARMSECDDIVASYNRGEISHAKMRHALRKNGADIPPLPPHHSAYYPASTQKMHGWTPAAVNKLETLKHFLLSKPAQELRPQDAAKIKKDEAYERFKEIRFGWTDGIVECPDCHAKKPYELKNRRMWRCRRCGDQFSITSGTIFAARKAPYETILHAISLRIHQPDNILQSAYALGVQYKTAHSWAKKFRTFLGNIKTTRVQDSRWPFVNGNRGEASQLIATVNGLLAREIPEQKRADIAQEMILGVLAGEISEADLERTARKYITRYHREYENRFRDVSFDALRGESGRSFHDTLSEERASDAWGRF